MLDQHIAEIRGAIKAGRFTNEAAVCQGIVLRILHALSWPTYDTGIVSPEYSVEGRRVDFALCHPAGKPVVIGYFYAKSGKDGGRQPPEFFTLPRAFIEQHHHRPESGFQKVRTKGLDLLQFKDDLGFEQIARDLKIPYPSRPA